MSNAGPLAVDDLVGIANSNYGISDLESLQTIALALQPAENVEVFILVFDYTLYSGSSYRT